MILPLLLAAAFTQTAQEAPAGPPAPPADAAAPVAGPPTPLATRYDQCVELATGDPASGEAEAARWAREGGKYFARQCMGIALANRQRWPAAAAEFEAAAQAAEIARDKRAAQYWAQAGNAWLAGGDARQARAALDAALAAGTLEGFQRGEAQFDRARALVAAGDLEGARGDLDRALEFAKEDPLVWLASATLARKMDDLPRARRDAAQAYERAPDDPDVLLEVGNIAAFGGDENGARSAWSDAIRLGPDTPAAAAAREALKQFDAPAPKP